MRRWRFREAFVDADGKFAISNIAPGRYLLLVRPVADNESSDLPRRTAAPDADTRGKLRRAAETDGVAIDIQPCQHLSDYTLRYAPPLTKSASV